MTLTAKRRVHVASWAVIVPLLLSLPACSPFKEPRLLAGSETTLTLEAGQWSDTESFARDYCARFGKRAVPQGTARISEDKLTSLFIYDCRDEKR